MPDVGKACSDGSFCGGSGTCNSHGTCVGTGPVDCSNADFGAIDEQCGRAYCSEHDKACKVCRLSVLSVVSCSSLAWHLCDASRPEAQAVMVLRLLSLLPWVSARDSPSMWPVMPSAFECRSTAAMRSDAGASVSGAL